MSSARQTLDILKPQTVLDDGAPPGLDSCPELCEWSSETDLTWQTEENNDEDPPDKIDSLQKMFPELGMYTLKRVLSSAQGDVDRAIDELLNRVFLDGDEEGGKTKGVDAFDGELGLNWGGKKGKRRGRSKNWNGNGGGSASSVLDENLPGDNAAESRWAAMSREVDYLAGCLGLEREKVLSAYHCHSGSIGRTIVALLEEYGEGGSQDPTHLDELHDLVARFGATVETDHLDKLLSLCGENKTALFRLAEILSRNTPPKRHSLGASSPTPFSPSTSTSSPSQSKKASRRATSTVNTDWTVVGTSSRRLPMSARATNIPRSPTSPLIYASTYASARDEAFAKASAAHKKSRSDRLMSGATAVYSEQGHEYNNKAREYSDIAAEALVDQNSSGDTLDLHGVTVKQAIKISRERTTQWWVRESTNRERRRRGEGKAFRVVTGYGKHSTDGKPRLLPAVSKMLIREGWDIQVQGGQILVWGVRK